MTTQEQRARRGICLSGVFASGRLRQIKDLGWSETFDRPQATLSSIGTRKDAIERFIAWKGRWDEDESNEMLEREGIRLLFPEDLEYPEALRHTSDPPEVLFLRGQIPQGPSVAIVGSRRMTMYGRDCLAKLIPECLSAGLTIVSGLALGIDGEAHRLTLEHKGKTLAILGTGINEDSLYPREHVELAHAILSHGGGILAECAPGAEARKEHFPQRNRLIAGLADATLVVEAAKRSGSLITAKCALEENKEVLAIPGPLWNSSSEGTNALIKAGARVCTGVQDILDALRMERPDLVTKARESMPLSHEERLLLEALSEPTHIDELCRKTQQPSYEISARLSTLELKGYAKTIGGQVWVTTASFCANA